MAARIPELGEIAGTVARLEARLNAADAPRARELADAYLATARRFEADLSDPRDVALAKGGALMLISALLGRE